MALINKNQFIEAEAIKKEINEIIVLFEKTEQAVKSITKVSSELHTATRNINSTGSGAEAQKRVELTKKLQKNTKELTAVEREQLRLSKEKKTLLAKLITAQNKQNQINAKGKIQLAELNKATKQNAREQMGLVGAFEKLSRARTKAQQELKNNIVLYGKESQQVKKSQAQFDQLDKSFRNANTAARDGRPDVGRYGLALKGVGQQLLGAAGIVGGVDLLIKGLSNFIQTANQVNEITKKVKTNFGATGDEARGLAVSINAIADTFEADYNQVLIAATAVSKELGISAEEALGYIEDGFLKGSNNSDEFLDILKEYPMFMKKAGIEAEQFFAMVNQQVTAGVYSDKGIDAIKEGTIQLGENTKAVQASLKPLGEAVNLEIERLSASGKTFEAMQLISKAMAEGNLTASEMQAIMSTVFRGAGEDAESFVKNLHNVKTNLKDVEVQGGNAATSSLALSKAWSKFASTVGDSEGVFGKAWTGIKKGLAGLLDEVADRTDALTTLFSKGYSAAMAKVNRQDGLFLKGMTGINKVIKVRGKLTNENIASTKNYINAAGDLVTADGKVLKTKNELISAYKEKIKLQKQEEERIAAEKAIEEASFEAHKANVSNVDTENQESNTKIAMEEALRDEQIKADGILEIQRELSKSIQKITKEQREKELADEKIKEEAKKELVTIFAEETLEFGSTMFADFQDQKVRDAQNAAEAEKAILQDQLDKGLISEQQFSAQVAEINNRVQLAQAKAAKRTALFDIAMNTASAVVKMLGSASPPANFIAAGLVAAKGTLLASFVAARPLPAYKDGIIGFKGKGTGTSDSNIVRISNNESVVTAEGTANAPLTLDAINRGLIKDSDISLNSIPQKNSVTGLELLADDIKRGNKLNEDILTVLLNGGYAKEVNGMVIEKLANGQINYYPKK